MTSTPGVISAADLYTLPEAQRRLRLGRHTFRQLRADGLPVLRIGRCMFVDGAALIDAIRRAGGGEATR